MITCGAMGDGSNLATYSESPAQAFARAVLAPQALVVAKTAATVPTIVAAPPPAAAPSQLVQAKATALLPAINLLPPTSLASGDCGAETAPGYAACMAAQKLALEKAYYDRVKAGTSAGPGGCGRLPSNVPDSGSKYTGAALQLVYDACMARYRAASAPATTPAAAQGPAPEEASPGIQFQPDQAPSITPGSPQVIPSAFLRTAQPSGGGGAVATFEDFARLTQGTAPPTPSSIPITADTFGAAGHVEAPSWAWVAGGVVALGIVGWVLHSKGVF